MENNSSANKNTKSQELDILGKYKGDLAFLENGRENVYNSLKHSDISSELINKKLERLDKSIAKLRSMIEEFENNQSVSEE